MPQDIEKLISYHERRLQKLVEQQAQYGIDTPPQVLTEIEDIEETIELLKEEQIRVTQDNEIDLDLVQRFLDRQVQLKKVLWEQLDLNSYQFRTEEDIEEGISLIAETLQKQSFLPDIIASIYDPDAHGGIEVGHRLRQHFTKAQAMEIEIQTIDYERKVVIVSGPDELPEDQPIRLLVVDDVAISGRTTDLAIEELKKKHPTIKAKIAVLFASKDLVEEREDIVYARVTNTHRVSFPWGWVNATGDFERRFRAFTALNRYNISWLRRPWGTEEIFTENEICSVRVHTIEANEMQSLQRHWYRDEIWFTLDDGVGMQIEEKKEVVEKGTIVLIPRGIWHRLYAGRGRRVQVLEVAFGQYDQINDIERLEDKYGRAGKDGSV